MRVKRYEKKVQYDVFLFFIENSKSVKNETDLEVAMSMTPTITSNDVTRSTLRGNEIEVKNTNTIRSRKTEKTGSKTANVPGTEKKPERKICSKSTNLMKVNEANKCET